MTPEDALLYRILRKGGMTKEAVVALMARLASNGGSMTSWLVALQTDDIVVNSTSLLAWDNAGKTLVGDDISLIESAPDSGVFDTIAFATPGKYQVTIEPFTTIASGDPTGFCFAGWTWTPAQIPSYWHVANGGDGFAVGPGCTDGGSPLIVSTPIIDVKSGALLKLKPDYVDAAAATINLTATSLYVVRII